MPHTQRSWVLWPQSVGNSVGSSQALVWSGLGRQAGSGPLEHRLSCVLEPSILASSNHLPTSMEESHRMVRRTSCQALRAALGTSRETA